MEAGSLAIAIRGDMGARKVIRAVEARRRWAENF